MAWSPYKFRIDAIDRFKFNMSFKHSRDISFSVTAFSLRVIGFWISTSPTEAWFRNVTVAYTVITIFFSMWVQFRGLYFSWEDFIVSIYIVCNSIGLFMDLLKIFVIFIHKDKFFSLIEYMQKNFFHLNYDQYETSIIRHSKQMCIYFICLFSVFSQITLLCYMSRPLILNIGKNETDRVLIFNMWLDLPLSISPYFEIAYVIQVGICYSCFDNIFCMMCLHIAGQFRILQYRVSNMPSLKIMKNLNKDGIIDFSNKCYAVLRKCIQQHQALIKFCDTLNEIFKIIILVQVLIFSISICFIGYQIVLVDLSLSWTLTFVSFWVTVMYQLWIFTYSCDCVAEESLNVASAVYAAPWIYLPMDKFGKMLRKDLQLITMRSSRACCMSACGFFPISLETYTKIMSTALSYFTLLKQQVTDTGNV